MSIHCTSNARNGPYRDYMRWFISGISILVFTASNFWKTLIGIVFLVVISLRSSRGLGRSADALFFCADLENRTEYHLYEFPYNSTLSAFRTIHNYIHINTYIYVNTYIMLNVEDKGGGEGCNAIQIWRRHVTGLFSCCRSERAAVPRYSDGCHARGREVRAFHEMILQIPHSR